jgi:uncharacterized protein (TIGR02217 family)
MSNLVYPTLPGLKWSSFRTPMWSATVKTSDSGREFARSNWSSPRYAYKLQYEFLRAGSWGSEYQQLVGFFNRVRGNFDTWLFDDVDDNTATDQLFGVGDGATAQYQLLRTLGTYDDPVYVLNGAAVVKVDGTVTSVTIDANGLVTFAVPPAAGKLLTWSGKFYWRCRFKASSLEFEQFMKNLWSARSVEFTTVKP